MGELTLIDIPLPQNARAAKAKQQIKVCNAQRAPLQSRIGIGYHIVHRYMIKTMLSFWQLHAQLWYSC